MIYFFFGVVCGLVIGWNVLPQPKWVADLYEKYREKWRNVE